MATITLKKINARARQIRKERPKTTWVAAIKIASTELRKTHGQAVERTRKKNRHYSKRGKVSGLAKPKSRVGTKPKYKVIHEVRRVSGISYTGGKVKVGDIKQTKDVLRSQLGQRAGYLEMMISSAKNKREKTALRKQKAEIISELNRIK